jgi:exosortase/archaeosortase family protein
MTIDQEPITNDHSSKENNKLIYGLPLIHWVTGLTCFAVTGLMYFWFESDRLSDTASLLFITIPRFLIPPMGLVFFAIGIIVLMGKNSPFEAYRSSALFLLELTAIFYFFIYSGIDHFLFESPPGQWFTRLTSEIEFLIFQLLNYNVSYTWITGGSEPIGRFYLGTDSKLPVISINGACSGVHSLSIFVTILSLMLVHDRKSINTIKVPNVILIGLLGTYLLNIIRVLGIMLLAYYRGWGVAEPIHDYLGFTILIIWVPFFWYFASKWIYVREEEGLKEKETDNEMLRLLVTYLLNIMQVLGIIILAYYQGWGVFDLIQDYLGLTILIILVPYIWYFASKWIYATEKEKEDNKTEE